MVFARWICFLYNKGEIAPTGDFVIKMLKEKELEEER